VQTRIADNKNSTLLSSARQKVSPVALKTPQPQRALAPQCLQAWPLHCMVYLWHCTGGRGASYIAQQTCNGIATLRAIQVGGGTKRIIDSCTKASQ